MFYSITGELVYSDSTTVAINCNGVAFQCRVTFNTLRKLGSIGSEVTLYTHLNVKEDALDLYGFYDREELEAFKLLIGVSGVGPKAGLSILSELDAPRLMLLIASGDYKEITKAQGVGPKVAQRVVMELKDKVTKGMTASSAGENFIAAASAASVVGGSNAAEAVSALVSLGYSQSEASIAVGKTDKTLSTDEIIKQALKKML